MKPVRIVAVILLAGIFASCATSPLGRRQLKMFPEAEMSRMGALSFEQLKENGTRSQHPARVAYVECVANSILDAMDDERASDWEVVVFEDESANAFALPGRKIGVHTGLLAVAENQHQLASVIGHEIGHVLAGHANERVSQANLAQAGMLIAQVAGQASGITPEQQQVFALLGLGVQVGVLLPYSRTHESEADLIGLDLMAAAGFEPAESVSLWQNMGRGGGAPPELLSTHPSHHTRIKDLNKRIPKAEAIRDQARAAGRNPNCR
ncbi:MAG: M48 family metallopeptidase [Myxococcota bacterium]|jgi:predicted Zn-dependent protease|nr:M48 family metallopeptidase [Myxococcota bacterium]